MCLFGLLREPKRDATATNGPNLGWCMGCVTTYSQLEVLTETHDDVSCQLQKYCQECLITQWHAWTLMQSHNHIHMLGLGSELT